MKKLPLGVQDIRKVLGEEMLYVDKTQVIYEVIKNSGYFFLSRPRRFGKSLLISTLHEIFAGNKSLFKGLWIEDKLDWQEYPVIRIDFSKIGVKELGLEKALIVALEKIAQSYQLETTAQTPGLLLEEIISSLGQKQQVVLLVDEYDKPIIDFLEDLDKAAENRERLKAFYSVIKGSDPYLKMVFLTGVSKFSKISIFSDLNNVTDISGSIDFANIAGYTQAELEHYFADRIEHLSKEQGISQEALLQKIKDFYNGYSWNGEDFLYNPFSVLSLFQLRQFNNFWFSTGTPTFLTKLLQKHFVYDLRRMKSNQIALDNLNLENPSITALLFQTGYLTIKEALPNRMLALSYPNFEVEEAMSQYLLAEYIFNSGNPNPALISDLYDSLREDDFVLFRETFNSLFASIPQDYFLENREKFYAAIVFLTLKLLGFFAQVEQPAGRGRLDAVVLLKDKIFVLEFKRDESAAAALAQIHERGYYAPYQNDSRPIYLLGINFISEQKSIEEVLVEKL